MTVYIVLHTYGDYIGWFDHDVLGVFTSEKAAEACRQKNIKLEKGFGPSKIHIEEALVKETA